MAKLLKIERLDSNMAVLYFNEPVNPVRGFPAAFGKSWAVLWGVEAVRYHWMEWLEKNVTMSDELRAELEESRDGTLVSGA